MERNLSLIPRVGGVHSTGYTGYGLHSPETIGWSQVKDSLTMSRPMGTGRLLLARGLTGTIQRSSCHTMSF